MKRRRAKHAHHHAIDRIYERYGIWVSKRDLDDACQQITTKGSKPLPNMRGTRSRSFHVVTIKGVRVAVAYAKSRSAQARIVTALPPDSPQIPYAVRLTLGQQGAKA